MECLVYSWKLNLFTPIALKWGYFGIYIYNVLFIFLSYLMFINVARLKIFQNKVNNEFKNNIF